MDSIKTHQDENSPPAGYGYEGSQPNMNRASPSLAFGSLSRTRYASPSKPRYGSVEPGPDQSIQKTGFSNHLPFIQKASYGMGHVFNDLCASMWFTYLLLFFHAVLQIDNIYAGIILLIGQVADAAATPVIGFLSDKTQSRYGRRKTWHLAGTIMVAVSFFFFWHNCLFCRNISNSTNETLLTHCNDDYSNFSVNNGGTSIQLKVLYFAIPIIIFQFGWAAVQISHLSLIPELTDDENERVGLNAIRYSATIVSNVAVFAVMFLLLETLGHGTGNKVVPADLWIFSGTALGVVGVGTFCSLLFHVGIREPSTSAEQKNEKQEGRKLSWYKWFLNPQFYMVAVIYMCTRLIVNLSQVYTPLYLTDSLELNKNSVAIGPLVIYISGFVMTLILKCFNRIVGRYMVYFVGLAFVWGGLIWFWVQDKPSSTVEEVFLYGSTVLIGAGGATILVTSLSMVADLIGTAVGSGAFVYGLMSFTDKISNGIAVAVIQALHPCKNPEHVCCSSCQSFYREVLVYVPGGASLLSCLALGVLTFTICARTCKDKSPVCPRRVSMQDPARPNSPLSVNGEDTETLLGKKK